MPSKYDITKCAIEFRVKQAELEQAAVYYETLFGVKRRPETYPDLIVLETDNKSGKWFFVSVRGMAEGSAVTGPVVYWLTEEPAAAAYTDLLGGRAPNPNDEPPAGHGETSKRGSIIDEYGNRFGFTNPDYPPLATT
ncbi:hypothetical protein [Hymenobacter sp. BT190]|uniref:hypothetical protein n=1 Tax=Hymenobacter sp. BT190 TaxID=2763505 RepID=UPI0016519D3A|nr:hypothetical protein [Hymenobacter sp. BT190]MBC6699887.1 hypothetical protein [Hymenobacter sp. BT190]